MYQIENTLEIISDAAPCTGPDGTNYPWNWDKDTLPFLARITETAPPTGPTIIVTGWYVDDDNTQVWETRPETDEERSNRERQVKLAEIDRLEASITDRMWREDAVGSTAVMTFAPDDPRTGKTATQYIAYVNSTIANIRAGL